jgi:glutamate--cysteine ligase
MMLAQSALWVGLLYDAAAQRAALALLARYPDEAFVALRGVVPRQALGAAFGGGTLRDLARDVVAVATDGLRARGFGEENLLAPLAEMAAGAPTQAERWLEAYHGAWGGNVTRIFAEAEV